LRQVQGTAAWVVPSAERTAYALPRRRDGIVVTQGTLDGLDEDQIAAVLAHEHAHVRGRHHAVIGALQTLAGLFAAVPLVAAAPAAVAGYAEMAADDAARRARGTRALAGALLALHRPGASTPLPALALHAARHLPLSRAQRLVAAAPPPPRAGVAVVAAYLFAMIGAVLLVSVPYLSMAVTASC
ncbi:M48 family metalloprotease, partial [Georgenia daeguensis]|uniref:M48 family metalloprotease n=1 Tax=Georgenia daeguensis TaxID=908355 RepID=UPI0031E98D77